MTESFTVIIPARFASTRLPGKVLLEIAGKPLLQHVYATACHSNAGKVVIATDNRRVFDAAVAFGAECIMTSPEHTSGTDRLAEAVEILGLADGDIVVNLQGDEIGMPSELVNQVAYLLLKNPTVPMATLYERVREDSDVSDPNVVKVVFDVNNKAIYFSRAPIPWNNKGATETCFRHIGLYAYRAGFISEFSRLPKCRLEQTESLEQLRALYHGIDIAVEEAGTQCGIGIDTEADLVRARERFA